jgi:hypothetical protein
MKTTEGSQSHATRGSQLPAWITAFVAVAALLATVYFQYRTREDQINHELLEHRRTALFDALTVIDHVYSNEPLLNGKPSNPHKWNIQFARDTDNQMRIYCKYPETVSAFRKAIGLYNPSIQKAPGVDLKALDDFRKQVAKELELPEPVGIDPNTVWINNLSGAVPSDVNEGVAKDSKSLH